MIRVMPATRGRDTGECGKVNRCPGEPCALKGARTVRRVVIGNDGYLLYLIGRWFDPSWAHLQFVVPCPTHVLFLSVFRWFQSKMCSGITYIINWNQVHFIKLHT